MPWKGPKRLDFTEKWVHEQTLNTILQSKCKEKIVAVSLTISQDDLLKAIKDDPSVVELIGGIEETKKKIAELENKLAKGTAGEETWGPCIPEQDLGAQELPHIADQGHRDGGGAGGCGVRVYPVFAPADCGQPFWR